MASLSYTERRACEERKWLKRLKEEEPLSTALDRNLTERFLDLLQKLAEPDLRAAELGFGRGEVTHWLCKRGVAVDAVEIAANAIKYFRKRYGEPEGVRLYRENLPLTELSTGGYDLVICRDQIGSYSPGDQRLLLSEIAKLAAPSGYVVISTALDFRTEGALLRLEEVIKTEITPIEWHFSHHSYYERSFGRLNWNWLKGREEPINLLEALCRLFSHVSGISHVTLIGKRQTL